MMERPRSKDNARFAVKYTDEDFIEAVEKRLKTATVSGVEIAEELGCNPRYATNRLKELSKKGKLESVEKGRAWGFRLKK
jgi:ribosomal protein S25